MKCPKRDDGVHVIEPLTATCACGYELRIPPISFSVEVFDRSTALIDEHFNTDNLSTVIETLQETIEKLEKIDAERAVAERERQSKAGGKV